MILFARYVLPLFMVVLLSGCPASESIVLYNNSGSEVLIKLSKAEFRWPEGSAVSIGAGDADIDWEDLVWVGDPDVRYEPFLILVIDGEFRLFKLVFPGVSAAEREGGRKYFLQLEDDKTLYVVKGGAGGAVAKAMLGKQLQPVRNEDFPEVIPD